MKREELDRLLQTPPDVRVPLAPCLMAIIDRCRAEARRRAAIVAEYRAALRSGQPVQARRRWGVSRRTVQAWGAWLRDLRGSARKVLLTNKPVRFVDLPASIRRPAMARWRAIAEWSQLVRIALDEGHGATEATAWFLGKHRSWTRSTLYRLAGRYGRYGIAGLIDLRSLDMARKSGR